VIRAPLDFDEAIVSWNVENPEAAGLSVLVRAIQEGKETKEFDLGEWSADASLRKRVSVNGQEDASGTVLTDTLHLIAPAQAVHLRVVMSKLKEGPTPSLKFLTVCFSNIKAAPIDLSGLPASKAWGTDIQVPTRAQGNYPNGGVLCSPTSVSMLLWHYSQKLSRPDLNRDVPEVEAGVWDFVYKGAGNWPFNVAFAGSFPGMRGYVARFATISDLEKWIEAGLPVACSVSFDLLRGKELSKGESGHLIVLTGFTPTGDPIVNDPAFKEGVHKIYPREDFEKAWLYSHRTVYLIYPEDSKPPEAIDRLWAP
jgi:hypothetical protein